MYGYGGSGGGLQKTGGTVTFGGAGLVTPAIIGDGAVVALMEKGVLGVQRGEPAEESSDPSLPGTTIPGLLPTGREHDGIMWSGLSGIPDGEMVGDITDGGEAEDQGVVVLGSGGTSMPGAISWLKLHCSPF